MLLTPAFAWQKGKPAGKPDKPGNPPASVPRSQYQPARPMDDGQHRRHKAGEWLRKYNNMPPEDQQRALENDQKFQQLPPERQQRLRERLKQFNAMSPEERERTIDRMGHWDEMSPEQRQRWRQFQEQFRAMPPEKSSALRQEFRSLRKMSSEERQKVFDSERFKQDYSESDKTLLQSMLQVADEDARREGPPKQDRF